MGAYDTNGGKKCLTGFCGKREDKW